MSIKNHTPPESPPWHATLRAKLRIGQRVWQWCSTEQALLWLLVPVAMALMASYLLPQAPAYLRSDELRYHEWLSGRQVQFKGWTALLQAIGAFRIRETAWFRVLLTALAFVLLVSVGEQLRTLYTPAAIRRPGSFFDSSQAVSFVTTLPYTQVLQGLPRAFGRLCQHAEASDDTYLYAHRHRWAKASAVTRYVGLLLLLGGLALDARWGWRQTDIQVLPYEDVALGPASDLRLRLLAVRSGSQHSTAQTGDVAELQIGGQGTLTLPLGAPIRSRGYRYLWETGGGPSVRLRAHRVSAPEDPLTLYDYAVRPEPAQALQFSFSPGQNEDHQFILPQDELVGWLRWLAPTSSENQASSQFHLWVFGEDGQRLGMETFEPTASGPDTTTLYATVEGIEYQLEVSRYIVLDIARQPGLWGLWLGGVLLMVSTIGELVPQRQIWVHAFSEGDTVVIKVREQRLGLAAAHGNRSHDTVDSLRDALERTGASQGDKADDPV